MYSFGKVKRGAWCLSAYRPSGRSWRCLRFFALKVVPKRRFSEFSKTIRSSDPGRPRWLAVVSPIQPENIRITTQRLLPPPPRPLRLWATEKFPKNVRWRVLPHTPSGRSLYKKTFSHASGRIPATFASAYLDFRTYTSLKPARYSRTAVCRNVPPQCQRPPVRLSRRRQQTTAVAEPLIYSRSARNPFQNKCPAIFYGFIAVVRYPSRRRSNKRFSGQKSNARRNVYVMRVHNRLRARVRYCRILRCRNGDRTCLFSRQTNSRNGLKIREKPATDVRPFQTGRTNRVRENDTFKRLP